MQCTYDNYYSGLFSRGGNFREKLVMLLKSNFCGSKFHGDSIMCYHRSHGWNNSWVEIFVTCTLTTKISTPRKYPTIRSMPVARLVARLVAMHLCSHFFVPTVSSVSLSVFSFLLHPSGCDQPRHVRGLASEGGSTHLGVGSPNAVVWI